MPPDADNDPPGGFDMRIELEKLEESGGRVARTYEIDQLAFDEQELRLIEPVRVEGRIRRKAEEVELRGKLRTKIAVPCSRCLKSVELPIDVEFAERFTPAVSWKDEEQHELSEDELNLAAFDGEGIDMDDLVREEEEHRGQRHHHEHHDRGDRRLAAGRPGDLGGLRAHFLQEFERAESHRWLPRPS